MPFVIPKTAAAVAAAAISTGPITVPIDSVEPVVTYKTTTEREYICHVKPKYILYENFKRVEYVRECGYRPTKVTQREVKFKIFYTINGKQISQIVDDVPGRSITLE